MREIQAILDEVGPAVLGTSDAQRAALADEIVHARSVFLAGVGRAGFVIKAFANRLMHVGLDVNVIGDATCKHTTPGDLLIVGSGSGETASLVSLAKRATEAGLRIALVTAHPSSAIGRQAHVMLTIPVQTESGARSIQPMASTFEQALLLTLDSVVLLLMDKLHETNEAMRVRHADLE